jgi:hypothetical protein
MKSLDDIKKELSLKKSLYEVYIKISKLRELETEEKKQFDDLKIDICELEGTIYNLELNIEYTDEELSLSKYPESEKSKRWLELIRNSDFKKETILRICSLLKTDGLLPMFKKEGISLRDDDIQEFMRMMDENYIYSAELEGVKSCDIFLKKLRNNEPIDESEKFYFNFVNKDGDLNSMSGDVYVNLYEFFSKMLYDEYKKTNDINILINIRINSVLKSLYIMKTLMSGEKELIAACLDKIKKNNLE